MGVRSKLLDAWDILGGLEPRSQKGLSISLEPGGFTNEYSPSYRRPSALHTDSDTLQLTMSMNELCFACINAKATAARGPRLLVQQAVVKKDKTTYEEVSGHELRQLIMHPNPLMTEGDLMRAAIVSWDVSNPRRFYCQKVYERGLLKELWPLNPVHMRPLASRADTNKIIGYTWSDGNYRQEYSFEEILVRAAPSWYDPAPLVAALGNTELDTAQTDTIRAFFENGGIPPGFLKYNMPLNDTQRDELRDKWTSRYGNRFGRQHNVGILDSNADWQETGANLDKLSNQMLRSVSESRICMVFGVPPLIVYAYVGLMRATYSNLREAWSGFWDATMNPIFDEWRDFWTWNLLTEFEDLKVIKAERVRLSHDMSRVAALQDDVDLVHKRAENAWRSGGISRAEYRAKIGEQSDPSDNFYLIPAGMQTVTVGEIPVAVAPRAVSPLKTKTKATPPSLAVIERRMEKAVQVYLQGEYMKAANAVRG